ncbi:MAG: hypothetical protein ACRCU2_03345 [Planktothrix sp.]
MNPQDLIAAFLEVWETNPNNIWEKSGAIQGLPKLNESLTDCQDKSDLELANELGQWCSDYEPLSRKIMEKLGEKKLRAENNLPPNTDNHALINQYPEITKMLQTRLPRMGKKEGQS